MTNKHKEILDHCVNDDLLKLRSLFQAASFDIRIVGGAVRDILCDQTPKDIDLCTSAYPDEAIAIYEANGYRFEPTGIDHGTISVIINGETYEITSLRYDTETDGRHAKVTFTRLWYEDLARRDLTINAMSMTFDGVLDDPYEGQKDLEAGVVRFVGDPALRIQEDYLRILRYFRFAGRFGGGKFDSKQIAAISKHAPGLKKVSRERVWQEVSKMMAHPSAPTVYEAMAGAGVLEHADLPLMRENVKIHMANALQYGSQPAVVFSTLFKTDEQVVDYGKRLKISTKDIRLMRFVLPFSHTLNDVQLLTNLQQSVIFNSASIDDTVQAALKLASIAVADEMKAWVAPVFPVNGDDLIALGMKPGKEIGSTLISLKYVWYNAFAHDGYYRDREYMLDLAKNVLTGNVPGFTQ
jgi:tRNA nucleotidyltransferase (CCA-adding enzyme)